MDELEQSARRKRWLIWLGIVLVLGTIAYFTARPAYRQVKTWRAHRFAAAGEALIQENNWESAFRQAQAALQLSPQNVRSMRLMAQVLTHFGQEQALPFWTQLSKLPGSTPEDRYEMIALAIRLRQWPVAREELNKALKNEPIPAEILRLASEFFGEQGDVPQAVKFARVLVERYPQSNIYKLFLVRRLFLSREPADQTQARTLLWQLASGQDSPALEALTLLPSVTQLTPTEAAECVDKLQRHPERTLATEFLALDLKLRLQSEPREKTILEAIQKFGALGDDALLDLVRWLARNREYNQVLKLLPVEKALTSQDLFLVYLDSLARLKRWQEVEAALGRPGAPLEQFIIAIYRVRVAMELGQTELVPLHWATAQRRAAEQTHSLLYLAQYAEKLGATEEATKAWRKLTEKPAAARRAYVALLRLAQDSGDTRKVRELVKEMTTQFPEDPVPQNDLAYLNLLLQENMDEARALSLKQYQENPSLLAHRITLSLAHLRFKDPAAARELFRDLNLDWSVTLPGWQAVYAAVLGNNKETAAARALAGKIPLASLRPEERALIQPWL